MPPTPTVAAEFVEQLLPMLGMLVTLLPFGDDACSTVNEATFIRTLLVVAALPKIDVMADDASGAVGDEADVDIIVGSKDSDVTFSTTS